MHVTIYKMPKQLTVAKGVQSIFFAQKNRTLSHLCFRANQVRKNRFLIYYKKIMLFYTRKVKFKKEQKKSKFLIGLVHGFCLNSKFFHLCAFLLRNQVSKSLFDILDRNECFLDQKIDLWKSAKKSKFAKGVHINGFCPKSELFLICVFWANKVKKKIVFAIFWIEKNAFLPEK